MLSTMQTILQKLLTRNLSRELQNCHYLKDYIKRPLTRESKYVTQLGGEPAKTRLFITSNPENDDGKDVGATPVPKNI